MSSLISTDLYLQRHTRQRSRDAARSAARAVLEMLEELERDNEADIVDLFGPPETSIADVLTTDGLPYEVQLQYMQGAVHLRESIRALPPWASRVLILRDFEGTSLSGMSRTLDASPSCVRRMHRQARSLLREQLSGGPKTA